MGERSRNSFSVIKDCREGLKLLYDRSGTDRYQSSRYGVFSPLRGPGVLEMTGSASKKRSREHSPISFQVLRRATPERVRGYGLTSLRSHTGPELPGWHRQPEPSAAKRSGSRDSPAMTNSAAREEGRRWMVLDFLVAFASGLTAMLWQPGWAGHVPGPTAAQLSMALFYVMTVSIVTVWLAYLARLHEAHRVTNRLQQQGALVLVSALAIFGVGGGIVVSGGLEPDRIAMLFEVALMFALMSLSRTAWERYSDVQRKQGMAVRNFVIAGVDETGREVRDYLSSLRYLGYRFRGWVSLDESDQEGTVWGSPVLGSLRDIIPLSKSVFVDEIIFTRRPETRRLVETLQGARATGIDVRLIPSIAETLQNRNDVQYVGSLPTVVLHQEHTQTVARFFKLLLDTFGAIIGMLFCAPIALIVSAAIKLDSSGPLIYSSRRVGYKGRVFDCYKFRTMVSDADKMRSELAHLNEREGVLFKISNDPRITRVGRLLRKYSLDELPQLWNVLRGDMSLVGPRPPISSEVAQYEVKHLQRLEVVPGITGLWQIEARNNPSFESYIELDRAYVSNWSLWLDVKILFSTVKVIVLGTGT